MDAPVYLFDAADKPRLPVHKVPAIRATDESLKGYGCLVDDPGAVEIEITHWPAPGWRPVDPDTGDEGGTTEGVFDAAWKGDVLHGINDAVGGHHVLGWSAEDPATARTRLPPVHATRSISGT